MRKFVTYICMTLILAFVGTWILAGNITETGMSQRDLVKFLGNIVTIVNEAKADFNLLRTEARDRATTSGSVGDTVSVNAATASAIKTSGFTYVIDGVFYSQAASKQLSFATTATMATDTYCRYLFSINAAGTVIMTKGTEATPSTGAYFPAPTAGYAPFAGVLVMSTGTTGFVGGLHKLTDTRSMSVVWYNLSYVGSTLGGTSNSSSAISASDLSLTGL